MEVGYFRERFFICFLISQHKSVDEYSDLFQIKVNHEQIKYVKEIALPKANEELFSFLKAHAPERTQRWKKLPRSFAMEENPYITQNKQAYIITNRSGKPEIEASIYGFTPPDSKSCRFLRFENDLKTKKKTFKQISTYNSRIEDFDQRPTFHKAQYKIAVPIDSFDEHCLVDVLSEKYARKTFTEVNSKTMLAIGMSGDYLGDKNSYKLSSFFLFTYKPYEYLLQNGHDRSVVFIENIQDWINKSEAPSSNKLAAIAENRVIPDLRVQKTS